MSRGACHCAYYQRLSTTTKALEASESVHSVGAAQLSAALHMCAAAAGNGGPPLDPKNGEDKKALNLLYDATRQNWSGLSLEQQLDRAIAFSAQKGIVPEAFQGTIRGALRSSDPAQVTFAERAKRRAVVGQQSRQARSVASSP